MSDNEANASNAATASDAAASNDHELASNNVSSVDVDLIVQPVSNQSICLFNFLIF